MLAIALALLAAEATPRAPAFDKYQADNETTCIGAADAVLVNPDSWTESGFKFTVKGGRAEVHAQAAPGQARLGLLAAGERLSSQTGPNLVAFLAALRTAGRAGGVGGGAHRYPRAH